MITPTGDLRPVVRAVCFENRTGIAIWPPDAPYGDPDTTPRIGTVAALASAGTATSATTVTAKSVRRRRASMLNPFPLTAIPAGVVPRRDERQPHTYVHDDRQGSHRPGAKFPHEHWVD